MRMRHRLRFLLVLVLVLACESHDVLRDLPCDRLVLVLGETIRVVDLSTLQQQVVEDTGAGGFQGVRLVAQGRVEILGSVPFEVELDPLRIVPASFDRSRVLEVPSTSGARVLKMELCVKPGHPGVCDLRLLDATGGAGRLVAPISIDWGLPVWDDDTAFYFLDSGLELSRGEVDTNRVTRLGWREVTCSQIRKSDHTLIVVSGNDVLALDPLSGKRKSTILTGWHKLGGSALLSPNERFLVYSRKRFLSEVYDTYVRDLAQRREVRVVQGVFFDGGAWLPGDSGPRIH